MPGEIAATVKETRIPIRLEVDIVIARQEGRALASASALRAAT